ncbi:MAG: protein translocase subunit SecD [Deltaproteobacteria bacterium]|nr:protein translocase subunit SecD [Deltaproteobacteria bacterium]NND28290.1 protein translocase subunit SecD [Myxococcales bacterium]MBT8463158.1 protein translocase subunit SecD [Deltaproteobacteria bacterium]MBT8482357.1 protein translocase subunit SecD [Deltaproteobacteria bacterium]NNK07165.1 protein translocase subunit SecD [Myxococcales bacterium]
MDRGWYFRLAIVVGSSVLGFLALWPSVDRWLPCPDVVKEVFDNQINPGLDIKGGLRLMYEVEVDEYIRDRRDRIAEQVQRQCGVLIGVVPEEEIDDIDRAKLDEIRQRCKVERVDKEGGAVRAIRMTFSNQEDARKLSKSWVKDYFRDLRVASGVGDLVVDLHMREEQLANMRETAVRQSERTITNRIDTMGVLEPTVIARPNDGDIIIEIPGAQESSFERIKSIISRTAQLSFKIVDDESDSRSIFTSPPEGIYLNQGAQTFAEAFGEDARDSLRTYIATLAVPDDHELSIGRQEPDPERGGEGWRTYYMYRVADATGEDLDDASVGFDPQSGSPEVDFTMNSRGASRMADLTGRNIGKRMAIVLDDRVESAPVIQGQIGGRGRITLGAYQDRNELLQEAKDLVVVLQAGALPAPLRPANEQLIGPTLGQDSVRKGAVAALVGVILVVVFMALYYQVAGLVADAMVLLNLQLLLGVMSGIGATLTLPGVAAIALTVGMAVDANVLITERIREELRLGKSPRSAVEQGYARAYSSVFDSQLTTAIAGVVLWQFGTGPIKGFATMLLIGIGTSLFTGTFCSKVLFDWLVRGMRVQRLRVG